MSKKQLEQLATGDEVFWDDPDGGACSKSITIRRIEIAEDIVKIEAQDGSYLECFAHELR